MVKASRHATEVEEILELIRAREFGPGESPLRELAQIGFLLRQGVTVNQITSVYHADHFPALRTPEAQSALVQLVEREGHETLISQVNKINNALMSKHKIRKSYSLSADSQPV